MRQTTKVKQILLRYRMISDLDDSTGLYKIALIDKKDNSRHEFENETMPNCINQAHCHFKKETQIKSRTSITAGIKERVKAAKTKTTA